MLIGIVVTVVLLAAILWALPRVLPIMLDRIYYDGPASDHYRDGRFFNPGGDPPPAAAPPSPAPPPRMRARTMIRFMLGRDRAPWPARVPVAQTRPPARIEGEAMRVTWIGHAAVLVQTQGLNILTDPVWSERASPFSFLGPKRVRAPGVWLEDLPPIDLVLLSHNHYDHLDVATLPKLWARDRPLIVTPLGNDAILAKIGVTAIARDWGERVTVRPGIEVIVDRVHHWSSRWGADRNRALWSGFTVTLPGGNLFFAGDTGAGDMRWPDRVREAGPVRLALLPVGAYLPREMMRASHTDPAEAVDIFERLGAAHALAIHWGTFQLSSEAIDAPPELLRKTLAARGIAADRFRAIEAGEAWEIPSLAEISRNPPAMRAADQAGPRVRPPAPA